MVERKESYFIMKESIKLKTLFFLLFFAVLFALGYIYRFYFWPFLFALILYIALRPFHDLALRYVKKRLLSSVLVILLLFMVVLIPLFLLLFSLAGQTYEFYQFLQQRFDPVMFGTFLHDSLVMKSVYSYLNVSEGEIMKKIVEVLQSTSYEIFSNLTNVLSFSIKFSVNFFFMLLMLFFLFKDGYRLDGVLYRVLPFPDDIERDVVDRLRQVIKVLITGNLLVMVLQGVAVGSGFSFFGVGMPILWGSMAAILSLIPVVGTALIWAPAVVYLLAKGEFLYALLTGAWCFLWYIVLENVVKPKIFGEKLHFHPLIFFFLLLGSIQAFGLPGIIIGPLLLTLFFSCWEIFKILSGYEEGM